MILSSIECLDSKDSNEWTDGSVFESVSELLRLTSTGTPSIYENMKDKGCHCFLNKCTYHSLVHRNMGNE